MYTFLIGTVILLAGYLFYGSFITKKMKPSRNRMTPAYYANDNADYVPLNSFKTRMIQALSIIGTGPIFGPILGSYFGPIILILIPIGNIIGGSVHDYVIGWVSLRNKGKQLSFLSQRFLGEKLGKLILIFVAFLLLLVSSVFVYAPIDVLGSYINFSSKMWLMYCVLGIIFAYYFLNTVFPIHKIIGKVYPFLGTIFILSAISLLIAFISKGYFFNRDTIFPQEIFHREAWNFFGTKITNSGQILLGADKLKPIVPALFITIACGILSGFHATQSPTVARCLNKEIDAKKTFFGMMTLEGFIAMIWASLAIAVISHQELLSLFLDTKNGNLVTPGIFVVKINELALGKIGGIIGVLCMLLLPLTSGETGFRALRLTIADSLHIKQKTTKSKIILSIPIFLCGLLLVIFAKTSSSGFNVLWSYFGISNIATAVIALAICTVYLYANKSKLWLITFAPFNLWLFMVYSYIIFNPYPVANKEIWKGNESIALIVALSLGLLFTVITSSLLMYKLIKGKKIEKNYLPTIDELQSGQAIKSPKTYKWIIKSAIISRSLCEGFVRKFTK